MAPRKPRSTPPPAAESNDMALVRIAAEADDLRARLIHSGQATANREVVARRMRDNAASSARDLRATASERDVLRRDVDRLTDENARLRNEVVEARTAYDTARQELELTQARLGYRLSNRVTRSIRRRPVLWRVTRGSVRFVTRR